MASQLISHTLRAGTRYNAKPVSSSPLTVNHAERQRDPQDLKR